MILQEGFGSDICAQFLRVLCKPASACPVCLSAEHAFINAEQPLRVFDALPAFLQERGVSLGWAWREVAAA